VRIYETTFIVNPQSDDSTIESRVKSVTDFIAENGGKIIYENRIGTRRLAYPIKRLTQGYYTSLIFDAEPDILPRIERMYKLDEAFIRYLTVVYEGDVSKLLEKDEGEAPETEREKPEAEETSRDPLRGRREEVKRKEIPVEMKEKKVTEVKKVEEKPAEVVAEEEKTETAASTEVEDKTKLTSPEDEEL
jgi:small subunit ribosomal protein S6